MIDQPILKPAKLSQAAALSNVYFNALEKVSRGVPESVRQQMHDNFTLHIQQEMQKPENHFVTISLGEKLIGFVHYRNLPEQKVKVEHCYTEENSCKAGKRLMNHVELFAQSKKALSIQLDAISYSEGFYKNIGYITKSNNSENYMVPMIKHLTNTTADYYQVA